MEYTYEELLEAYRKLKTYTYYDSSNLIMRSALAEFETGLSDDSDFLNRYLEVDQFAKKYEIEYEKGIQLYELKLKILTKALNQYHEKPEYLNTQLSRIGIRILPKKIDDTSKSDQSIISNIRSLKEYNTERFTAFIAAPLEIHIISVLWIIKSGVNLDAHLSHNCYGNRLILNKKRDSIVQGSALFKPYARQYQKWRDDAISTAKVALDKGQNVSIINLDVKDFFYSCRIPLSKIKASPFSGTKRFVSLNNLYTVFGEIHSVFTEHLLKFNIPYNFSDDIKDSSNPKVVLPIGLLSSFVLANFHLSEFDSSLTKSVKPLYYGRYVDDIIIVTSYNSNEKLEVDMAKYLNWLQSTNFSEEEKRLSNSHSLNNLEKYILSELHPSLSLIDSPSFLKTESNTNDEDQATQRVFKLSAFERLYCQSQKTLMYQFDSNETSLVIDKLKRDLEEKSSEFRNYDDSEKEEDFEESAYHLLYDGSEGKLRTLKDYKEDRFGLAVYLSKRIFNTLRKTDSMSDEAADKIVHFFKGINTLNLYTLWERVFTLFLVNKKPVHYVQFYLNTIYAAQKLVSKRQGVESERLQTDTLYQLELANELALSLNPAFLTTVKEAYKTYEYSFNDLKNYHPFYASKYSPTSDQSFYISRFRRSNLIRHHYCAQPLITYTSEEKNRKSQYKDFTDINLRLNKNKYSLSENRLSHSPRALRLWEVSIATFFEKLSGVSKYRLSDIEIIKSAFESYLAANSQHSNDYKELSLSDFVDLYPLEKKSNSINEIAIKQNKSLVSPKIAIVNTKVHERNIELAIQDTPNLSGYRFDTLYKIFKQTKEEKADILLFPECFIPVELLDRIVWFSVQEQTLVVTGLEHITINNISYNFIVTILPFEKNGIKDAIVSFRIKNHYSYGEQELITTNHCKIPSNHPKSYTLFNWRNIYFSPYYCFELADVHDRSLFKGKMDLLIASEYNRDVNYFSNIVESISRDLHTYVAQVNTSDYGDSRITQPAKTAVKDILKLKGGENDTILVGKLDINELRNFQRNLYLTTKNHPYLKPLPPNYQLNDVLVRINNGRYFT